MSRALLKQKTTHVPPSLKPFASLNELEARALPNLTDATYGYYASGAEEERTLRDNEAAFARWRLLPRVLVDVSTVDTSCSLLGRKLSCPVLVAPMAMQHLCHPDGELAVARAAASMGSAMILSTMSTASIEEVAEAHHEASREAALQQQQAAAPAAAGQGGLQGLESSLAGQLSQQAAAPPQPTAAASEAHSGHLWFQIYVLTRRDVTEMMVKEAEALGYTGLIVTVDAPRLGKRDKDERNKFTLPEGLALKNLEKMTQAAARVEQAGGPGGEAGSQFGRHFSKLIDDGLTWEFLPWLKSVTRLPVLVKGILSPDDARRAVELGADGIIVSNHGGRQLDTSPATIDVLPFIVRTVAGRVPVLVDGGVRRGTDVVKCLALGAAAVLLGRPVLWGLALGGQAGVESVLEVLQREVELSMALLGCRNVGEVTSDFVIPPAGGLLQLPKSRL